MRKHIEEFLKVLRKKKEIVHISKIVFQGGIPSLNDLYGTKHWTSRHRDSVKYHAIFMAMLRGELGNPKQKAGRFSVWIFFNSRHDTDNIVGIEKYFTDMLVSQGYVEGDNKRFFRTMLIAPDETLKKNTVEFLFATHNDNHKKGSNIRHNSKGNPRKAKPRVGARATTGSVYPGPSTLVVNGHKAQCSASKEIPNRPGLYYNRRELDAVFD